MTTISAAAVVQAYTPAAPPSAPADDDSSTPAPAPQTDASNDDSASAPTPVVYNAVASASTSNIRGTAVDIST